MFQTFSGSSRRPRQVNLSGQNTNPFSASSWTPTASGTQKTVAAAQQERQQRQRERERLNAAKQIQRTWRGHNTRRGLADQRRQIWDLLENQNQSHGFDGSYELLINQLRLLVTFYSIRNQDDQKRLELFAQHVVDMNYMVFFSHQSVRPHLLKIARILLTALEKGAQGSKSILLAALTAIVKSRPEVLLHVAPRYFTTLSTLLLDNAATEHSKTAILTAANEPFSSINLHGVKDQLAPIVYSAYALYFFTTPGLLDLTGSRNLVDAPVDVDELAAILAQALPSANIPAERQLWLLAHLIKLHWVQKGSVQEPEYLRVLSLLLSSCADEILARLKPQDPDLLEDQMDEDDSRKAISLRLPGFVEEQLTSLVNQASISGLLTRFNLDYNNTSGGQEDATALANYALMLLRIFPERGDELRMWLYMGSMIVEETGDEIPAVKFFWQAMRGTASFATIAGNPKAALALLRRGRQELRNSSSENDRDWGTILLFLELYAFVLRFTDDEEFLSGGVPKFDETNQPPSRFRESALPIDDVKLLTTFLKNLAFTMYYNTTELFKDDKQPTDGGLSVYFGNTARGSTFGSASSSSVEPMNRQTDASRQFAGISGMTFNYVRETVTGVMRMIYERDSRRRFLPKDHWLMTSQFDMEGFIPAVVMEEERQHEVAEDEEENNQEEEEDASSYLGLVGTQQSRRAYHLERLRRQQQHAARKKVMAMIGPRLEVLQHMPFVIPFETRVRIFRQFVTLDQIRRRNGNTDPELWRMSMVQQAMSQIHGHHANPREVLGRHHAKIRRDNVFEDAFEQFYNLGEGLKEPIQITFVDQFDTVEAGIDGGGVTKEFLTSVTTEAFRTSELSLFITNDQNLLYPNPSSVDARKELLRLSGIKENTQEWHAEIKEFLQRYEFLGRVVGKCLYEGILVDIGFAGFFLLKWASAGASGSESAYRANINDLRDLDESLYQGLLQLKNYPGNVEDFSLDFTITDTVSLPSEPTRTITRELLPGGSSIAVNNENRPLYISCVTRHRLQVQPFQQTQAFLRGLRDIIKPSWLSMFNQSELQTLISGEASQIDVEDLRANTIYGGVYVIGDDGLEHSTIQLFWQVMHELDDTERRKVLKYVTSTPRAPLLGFSQLNPKFSIRDAGNDESRLPSTSTCVNLLKLPRYSNAVTLRQKLLYAVNSGAGFDLS